MACAKDPAKVCGWCEDHRAGWGADRANDEADRGRRLAMPLPMLRGEAGALTGKNGVELWRDWAGNIEGEALPCGHFIPEEQPEAVVAHFQRFFGEAADQPA